MSLKCGMLVAALLLSDASLASAQEPLNIDRLPVNLERLERALRESAIRDESQGLNVRYTVDVYGQAPKIELFSGVEDWATGPVPYGAPSHREMLEQMTPQEFRAPAADLNAFVRWLMERTRKK